MMATMQSYMVDMVMRDAQAFAGDLDTVPTPCPTRRRVGLASLATAWADGSRCSAPRRWGRALQQPPLSIEGTWPIPTIPTALTTRPARYDPAAAERHWRATEQFFGSLLGS